MLNFFEFRGRSSLEFGLYLTDKAPYSAPERDITRQSIPGRDGDIINDNGRYKNQDVSYTCRMISDSTGNIAEKAIKTKAWLCAGTATYYPLMDSYNQNFMRWAAVDGAVEIKPDNVLAEIPLKFSCKPYLYSLEGQKSITLTKPGTLYNEFAFGSVPYLKIYGSGAGVLTINGAPFNLLNIDEYIEIEGETGDAAKGGTDCNGLVKYDYAPAFVPGENRIEWSGGIAQIDVIPRWRTL